MNPRVLIIGGAGVFGKRLVRHLSASEGLDVYVSSRSLQKARETVHSVSGARAALIPVQLNCRINLDEVLNTVRPFAAIDCSGPFQTTDYGTALQIVDAGVHLIDLADARGYLAGFSSALDRAARQRKVSALTGASSTPTLSACVATELVGEWRRVDGVDICITPGGRSEVGRSVIEAILSYAGEKIPIWRNGGLAEATGWADGVTMDMPGLGLRRVAPVETFDAENLGQRLSVQSRVAFYAGLESRLEQRGIECLAALRKRRWVGSLKPLIPLLLAARKVTRLTTSASGGMLVKICGVNKEGVASEARWALVAEQDHGPFIPVMPAAAALRKLLAGSCPEGARLAHEALDLSDIMQEMHPYAIRAETFVTVVEKSLFERALGAAGFAALPGALQEFHSSLAPTLWSGVADVEGGRWFAPKAIARLFGLPKAGRKISVAVNVDRNTDADGRPIETWTRWFAGAAMTSDLRNLKADHVTERFAPFDFELGLEADASGLRMPVTAWRIGPLKLPKSLAPRSDAREYVDELGRFCFDVRLSVPLFGVLAHYRGWLTPGNSASPASAAQP